MADLTNPFLNTSKLRSQLLADLSSDVEAPNTFQQSSPSVSSTLGVDQQAFQVLGVTANIANNGGTYNPEDTTDYSGYVQSNPVEAWNDFQTYGKAALGVLGFLGMPGIVTGAIAGAAQQNIANTFSDLIGNYVGPIGGVMADKTGLLEAAMRGALPGIGAASDQTSLGNLMNQFGSTDAAIGYFTAATDKNIGDIVSGMLDGAEVNSAEYGRVGSLVSNAIQSNIANGMSYDEAVTAAQTNFLGAPIVTPEQQFQNSVTEALSGMQNQITDLASSYTQQGLSLSEALEAAKVDLQTQMTDLQAAYEAQGLSQQEALDKAMTDVQDQFGTQNQTISDLQTAISNYQQQGLDSTAAMQQALADMQTGLQGAIDTQGQQFQELLAQNQSVMEDSNAALQQTIADMQTNIGNIQNTLDTGMLTGNTIPTTTDSETSGVGTSATSPDNIDVGGGWSPADTTPAPETPSTPNVAIDVTFPTIDPNTTYVVDGSSSGSTGTSGGYDYSGVDYGNSGWGTDYGGGYDSYGEAPSSSGSSDSGGGGGGGKIVCTAMNEAYGFGSFRNRIWLKYAKDNLTKAHEVGYHTLFLPLVDLGYKKDVKVVRKALEHIARHRSADLRAEMRGTKRDSLGRVYRFFLEPLCYVVGKLKGY